MTQLIPLTSSVGNLGDYSDGASLSVSMTQWDLDPLNQDPNEVQIQWFSEAPKAEFEHTITIRTTSGAFPVLDESVLLRAACYYLLTKLPDAELPEICHYIADAYDSYEYSKLLAPRIVKSQPQVVKAKVGKTYTRPSFPIIEE
jgi:hypothetical protein